MGHTTISVEESTLERFKSLKAELDDQQDAPDHTANSFLQALLDTWEAVEDGLYDGGVGDLRPFDGEVPDFEADAVPEDVREQLDRIEESVATIEDHMGARYK